MLLDQSRGVLLLRDQALNEALPSLVSFAVSFVVIGLFCFGHHGLFRHIVALDRRLIGLNLIFLGTIAFLPYPTELLNATSGTHPGASIFYAACGAAAGLAELAVWVYATHAKAGLTHRSASLVRQHYALRTARIPTYSSPRSRSRSHSSHRRSLLTRGSRSGSWAC